MYTNFAPIAMRCLYTEEQGVFIEHYSMDRTIMIVSYSEQRGKNPTESGMTEVHQSVA